MSTDPKDDKLDDLFAAARKAELYKKQKEYGFETRVLARIRERRGQEKSFLFWAWRLVPFFAFVLVCTAIWISFSESSYGSDLIAGAGIGNEDAVIVTYLAGE